MDHLEPALTAIAPKNLGSLRNVGPQDHGNCPAMPERHRMTLTRMRARDTTDEMENLPSQCDDLINLRLWHNRRDGLKVAGKDARTDHECGHECQKNAEARQSHSAELISSDRPQLGRPPQIMLNV